MHHTSLAARCFRFQRTPALRLTQRLLVVALLALAGGTATSGEPVIDEQFNSVERWEEIRFRGVERPSEYSIVEEEGRSLLRLESSAGGSAIVHGTPFDVYDYPVLEWRWRIHDTLAGGDLTTRDGDDYAVRLYVNFEYDPDRVGIGTRIEYALIRLFYGRYPPHAAVVYIWSNRRWPLAWYENPFTSRARMLPLDQGPDRRMQWRVHRRNILDDYREAFGEDPPRIARLAIMGDSDGTGESSLAWIDWVRVGPPPSEEGRWE